jgi:predicted naringenin-chalcone synthase
MNSGIIGLANAVPEFSVSQEEAFAYSKMYSKLADHHNRKLEDLYRFTTIKKRSSVLLNCSGTTTTEFFSIPETIDDMGPGTFKRMQKFSQHAAILSLQACNGAIAAAKITSDEITHIISVSCTGFDASGFDIQLMDLLGLRRDIARTHIGFMGCHGAINALRVADSYCSADPQATILVCATEICSIHFQYGSKRNDLVANSLFADGSAALIMRKTEECKIRFIEAKSYVIPETLPAITWEISDNGFVMGLSGGISSLIEKNLPQLLNKWVGKYSLKLDDINAWVVHPGGPRIIDAVQNCLALPEASLQESREILAEYGNMSSPTVLFILKRLLEKKKKPPFIMLAFGPGLTIEFALFN